MLVPVSGTVSTQLTCDIEPEAGSEVQWNQLNSDGDVTPITEGINPENFNLTLMANISSNGTVYWCTVTFDNGENLSYHGANITLRTAGKLHTMCTTPK